MEKQAIKIKFVKLFFGLSSKRSRWLAYKLRKEQNKYIILSLKNEQNIGRCKNEDLKAIVQKYYEELYRQPDTNRGYR